MGLYERFEVSKHPHDQLVQQGASRRKRVDPVCRLGYLFNVRISSLILESKCRVSCLRLYFASSVGETFYSVVPFRPYFYLKVRRNLEGVRLPEDAVKDVLLQLGNHVQAMATRACKNATSVEHVERIDLEEEGNLSKDAEAPYSSRQMLKVSVSTVDDMRALVTLLGKLLDAHAPLLEQIRCAKRPEAAPQLISLSAAYQPSDTRLAEEMVLNDPLLMAEGLCEHQVSYLSRALIDTGIRCGKWYDVTWHPDARRSPASLAAEYPESVELRSPEEHLQKVAPPLRIFSWDIEVTKAPLKFPDSAVDPIMCISIMVDDQGYLLVNNSIVQERIPDFDYVPKPQFQGYFQAVNVEDEKQLLQSFFKLIQRSSPHVIVTYNGDSFDFPYVLSRAKSHGISMEDEIGFPMRGVSRDRNFRQAAEVQGAIALHMDCLCWVNRDSYLPLGSRGLKAVTREKLRFNPRELDPELMTPYATSHPRLLAEYSVSDALATHFLYVQYIHRFILALSSIIPLAPDDVLRKGSGTLCEHLLMAQATENSVVYPTKHVEDDEKYYKDRLLYTETYIGGKVDQLNVGIFRDDIPEEFELDPQAYQRLVDGAERVFDFWLSSECPFGPLPVINREDILDDVRKRLSSLQQWHRLTVSPRIYHLDVAAMYPNIILTQRLQPSSMVDDQTCQACPWRDEMESCRRLLKWRWRGEHFPLTRGDINQLRNILSGEYHDVGIIQSLTGRAIKPDKSLAVEDEEADGKRGAAKVHWRELQPFQQRALLFDRAKKLSQRQSRKFKLAVEEDRHSVVCQRQNPFYVDAVRAFRDRRTIYKKHKKEAESKLEAATSEALRMQFSNEVLLFESLQLAHKCILNSFYGYVMRKGSHWHSMEMAAVTTFTGAQIINEAYELCAKIGKPLELDTDGIWTLFPTGFPEIYNVRLQRGSEEVTAKFEYPCAVLNLGVHDRWTNHQFLHFENGVFRRSSENSIFFEMDGPYKAMMLPCSEKEGQKLKKRYVVYDFDDRIVECKGFEIKRRGELEMLKNFQKEMFPVYLKGSTREEVYREAAKVCGRWLAFLQRKGGTADKKIVFSLISESKSLSKSVEASAPLKTMGTTTARRLTELLGDMTYVQESGIKCEFVVSAFPSNKSRSERAIPVRLFEAAVVEQAHFLQKWTGSRDGCLSRLLDWDYYTERLTTQILKLVVCPAILQRVSNPVEDVKPPEWLRKELHLKSIVKLDSFFTITKSREAHVPADRPVLPPLIIGAPVPSLASSREEPCLSLADAWNSSTEDVIRSLKAHWTQVRSEVTSAVASSCVRDLLRRDSVQVLPQVGAKSWLLADLEELEADRFVLGVMVSGRPEVFKIPLRSRTRLLVSAERPPKCSSVVEGNAENTKLSTGQVVGRVFEVELSEEELASESWRDGVGNVAVLEHLDPLLRCLLLSPRVSAARCTLGSPVDVGSLAGLDGQAAATYKLLLLFGKVEQVLIAVEVLVEKDLLITVTTFRLQTQSWDSEGFREQLVDAVAEQLPCVGFNSQVHVEIRDVPCHSVTRHAGSWLRQELLTSQRTVIAVTFGEAKILRPLEQLASRCAILIAERDATGRGEAFVLNNAANYTVRFLDRVDVASVAGLPVGFVLRYAGTRESLSRLAMDVLFARNLKKQNFVLWNQYDSAFPEDEPFMKKTPFCLLPAIHRRLSASFSFCSPVMTCTLENLQQLIELSGDNVYKNWTIDGVKLGRYDIRHSHLRPDTLLILHKLLRSLRSGADNSMFKADLFDGGFECWLLSPLSRLFHPDLLLDMRHWLEVYVRELVRNVNTKATCVKADTKGFIVTTPYVQSALGGDCIRSLVNDLSRHSLFRHLSFRVDVFTGLLVLDDTQWFATRKNASGPIDRLHSLRRLPAPVSAFLHTVIETLLTQPTAQVRARAPELLNSKDVSLAPEAARLVDLEARRLFDVSPEEESLCEGVISRIEQPALLFVDSDEDDTYCDVPGAIHPPDDLDFARIAYRLLSLDPASVTDDPFALLRRVSSSCGVSAFSNLLQYRPLIDSLWVPGTVCRACDTAQDLDATAAFDGGGWPCTQCGSLLDPDSVDQQLADLLRATHRHSLSSDEICERCPQRRRTRNATCTCGGAWKLDLRENELSWVLSMAKSLVSATPDSLLKTEQLLACLSH